jgi:hypothetical protein
MRAEKEEEEEDGLCKVTIVILCPVGQKINIVTLQSLFSLK